MKSILCVSAVLVALCGCQTTTDRDNKLAASTILGAATGIIIASQFYGSGSSGGYCKNFHRYGRRNRRLLPGSGAIAPEKEALAEAAYKSLESSKIGEETVSWHNEDTETPALSPNPSSPTSEVNVVETSNLVLPSTWKPQTPKASMPNNR